MFWSSEMLCYLYTTPTGCIVLQENRLIPTCGLKRGKWGQLLHKRCVTWSFAKSSASLPRKAVAWQDNHQKVNVSTCGRAELGCAFLVGWHPRLASWLSSICAHFGKALRLYGLWVHRCNLAKDFSAVLWTLLFHVEPVFKHMYKSGALLENRGEAGDDEPILRFIYRARVSMLFLGVTFMKSA